MEIAIQSSDELEQLRTCLRKMSTCPISGRKSGTNDREQHPAHITPSLGSNPRDHSAFHLSH